MVMTEMTVDGITHEMWLPVMDGANKAMKDKPYTVKTKYKEMEVQPATMFDINTAIMRCLTKNISIFGLGLYIYAGEDLPEESEEKKGWTTKNDPRVTKVGKVIRKTSIDELPQLFNVLRGDMSLIGPRPERPQYVEKFREEIPRYMVKHQVRPGMTGWAQVNGYRGNTSIRKRIEYDIYYIEHWSVAFDIKILVLTVFKGFINRNAY
jgi:lipopolysaccharide/colanic/teichoic acid biosynthesis glycosyltransferase